MKWLRALCTGMVMLTAGCSSVPVEDYASNTPVLDIRKYLNGDIEAWGMFVDRSGKADPMFQVVMKGTWEGNTGTLQEHFIYSDGHTQDRLWKLTFTDEHHFIGTADDVIGEATGTQFGNAVNMKYVLTVKTKSGSSYDMSMDDWLYQMDDKIVLNHNVMSKFGITAGRLVITFQKK